MTPTPEDHEAAAPDLEAMRARIAKAHATVSELCHGARWTMRIPANEDTDPDLIIGAALRDADALLLIAAALAEAVRVALEDYRKSIDVVTRAHHAKEVREAVRVAVRDEREATEPLAGLALKLAIAVRHAFERSDATAMRCFGTNAPAFFAADIERALRARTEAEATPAPEKATECGASITPNEVAYQCELPPRHLGQHRALGTALTWGTPPETKERGR